MILYKSRCPDFSSKLSTYVAFRGKVVNALMHSSTCKYNIRKLSFNVFCDIKYIYLFFKILCASTFLHVMSHRVTPRHDSLHFINFKTLQPLQA